jgi:hypothetical protein
MVFQERCSLVGRLAVAALALVLLAAPSQAHRPRGHVAHTHSAAAAVGNNTALSG